MIYQLSVRELSRTEEPTNAIKPPRLVVRSKRPANILRNNTALVNIYDRRAKKPGELILARSKAHCTTKPVVTVFEFRRDATSRRHASDLDLVPPGAASRGSPRSSRWTLRIARGRFRIVTLVVPVRAPFVNVLRYVVKPESIRSPQPNSLGPVQPELKVIRLKLRTVISPCVQLAFESSPRGSFPLRFCRKAIEPAGVL